MKKLKIVIAVLLVICILFSALLIVYNVRGNINSVELPQNFEQNMAADVFDCTGDVRIMSANLLVHYASWGGLPAKPRAKQYVEVLKSYKPDVVGIQELSDGWFCCLNKNLPNGYKMLYPFSTGTLVRMTSMIYNTETLNLVESGNFAYENGDNPRLRRVVWAVFELKENGKKFAVTSTHFDLLRDGREEELTVVMESQKDELLSLVDKLSQDFDCPVFSVGDFNTMEDTAETREIDIPAIYNSLAEKLVDTKFTAENQLCGTAQAWLYPSYDHIFMKGNSKINSFCLMSYDYLTNMSDHYPVFADITL